MRIPSLLLFEELSDVPPATIVWLVYIRAMFFRYKISAHQVNMLGNIRIVPHNRRRKKSQSRSSLLLEIFIQHFIGFLQYMTNLVFLKNELPFIKTHAMIQQQFYVFAQ